jgi:hypothetical protein
VYLGCPATSGPAASAVETDVRQGRYCLFGIRKKRYAVFFWKFAVRERHVLIHAEQPPSFPAPKPLSLGGRPLEFFWGGRKERRKTSPPSPLSLLPHRSCPTSPFPPSPLPSPPFSPTTHPPLLSTTTTTSIIQPFFLPTPPSTPPPPIKKISHRHPNPPPIRSFPPRSFSSRPLSSLPASPPPLMIR